MFFSGTVVFNFGARLVVARSQSCVAGGVVHHSGLSPFAHRPLWTPWRAMFFSGTDVLRCGAPDPWVVLGLLAIFLGRQFSEVKDCARMSHLAAVGILRLERATLARCLGFESDDHPVALLGFWASLPHPAHPVIHTGRGYFLETFARCLEARALVRC